MHPVESMMRLFICEPFPDYKRLNTEFANSCDHGVLLQGIGLSLADKEVRKLCNSSFPFLHIKSCGIDLLGYVREKLLAL